MKDFIVSAKSKLMGAVGVVSGTAVAVASSVPCFAAETDIVTPMTTALTGVQTNMLAVLGAVGPIGVTVAGVYICWKKGIIFFRGLAG